MNERIRELAEEHGFIHEHMTIGERNDALSKYKKFTELIVWECADALNTMPQYYKTEHDKQIERNTICDSVRTILEHFGVEE